MAEDGIELTERQIQQLAHDAVILAAAALIFVPLTERRALRAAARTTALLLPRPSVKPKRRKTLNGG